MSVATTASTLIRGVKILPRKIFGTRNDRLLKFYRRQVPAINALEPEIRSDFDTQWTQRPDEDHLDELPEEERDAAFRKIRYELSEDLRARTRTLRERTRDTMAPLHEWWNSLSPHQRMDEYFKNEYRKRNAKFITQLEQRGFLGEAFAILREASRRAQNHRHFDCQLIGGRVLFEGRIAEMKTGEGKTIVCHLAAFANVLCGRKIHIITVNDYLVKRDAEFAQPIFELLDVSVGYIQALLDPGGREGVRQKAYACDITYGTNSEFGFDYLRDNMKTRREDQVQGRLDYVIVDEVDSILIDEARTPLIISGPAYDDVTRYPRANKVAEELVRRQAVWDRKVLPSVTKYDGDARNVPKLDDAMNILGYKERGTGRTKATKNKGEVREPEAKPKDDDESDKGEAATLGPDFLTDDQVEAIQIFEREVLGLPAAEVYRRYFIVQMERKQVGLTHEGVTIAQELLDIGSLYSGSNMEWPHLIENSLRAHKVYKRDIDYVVHNGQIIIVDPFTGRLMHGRQWSDGLHQSVEAKEHVVVKEETQTLATITIQNFIKLYPLRAGMTGTAMTEATEFDKIYRLDVVEIPTNRPVNRRDHNDKMYRDVEQKFEAIVEEIHEIHRRGRPADPFLLYDSLRALRPILAEQNADVSKIDKAIEAFQAKNADPQKVTALLLEAYDACLSDLVHGRPILVGTTSVENSEKLSRLLTLRYGIDHEVLNAKNHAREAEIVAKAGQVSAPTLGGDKTPRGHVTIATNMAGRGTDIKLGPIVVYEKCRVPKTLPEGTLPSALYPTAITKCCIHCEEYDPATNCAHCFKPKIDPRFPALGRNVCPIAVPCGLHIIGTERHEARRIDNQLRGRSGRQGDPGSSRFSLSLQDDLLKLFMSDWMLKKMAEWGFADGGSLEDKRLNKGIERAQRKVEERNFAMRKHLLEWDEPMDYQRKEFYVARQRILEERDLPGLIFATVDKAIQSTLAQFLSGRYNRTCVVEWCRQNLDLTIDEDGFNLDDLETAQRSIRERAKHEAADQIRTSLGEYIDAEEPPSEWDVGGLHQWAQRTFKISVTQNQLRKLKPQEIEELLIAAAERLYDEADLSGISLYLDSQYPLRALAEWARNKFAIKLDPEELTDVAVDRIASLLHDRVKEAYREREINYPVEWCLERAFAAAGTDNAAAADFLVQWVNAKYNLGWALANIQGRTLSDLRDELTAVSREFHNGRLEREIDENTTGKDREVALQWARQRFAFAWNQVRLDTFQGEWREAIADQGREMLRWELTRLEQFVLLRLYDQAWKDHLLEMDHLKSAIMQRPLGGDQTHPQSQFAIEGRDLFDQMWARIAGRVTDIVFKIKTPSGDGRAAVPTAGTGPGPAAVSYQHADATGAGFAGVARDQAAAMRAQNVEAKVETIRRETPKVGRNDPCPCGSGKKYKQCHGKQ